jgi:hypothetical protein
MLVSEGKTLVAQNWRVIWKASFLSLVLTLWCGIYTDHNQKHDLQKSCLLHHFSLSPLDLLVVSNGWDRDSGWWLVRHLDTNLFSICFRLWVGGNLILLIYFYYLVCVGESSAYGSVFYYYVFPFHVLLIWFCSNLCGSFLKHSSHHDMIVGYDS